MTVGVYDVLLGRSSPAAYFGAYRFLAYQRVGPSLNLRAKVSFPPVALGTLANCAFGNLVRSRHFAQGQHASTKLALDALPVSGRLGCVGFIHSLDSA